MSQATASAIDSLFPPLPYDGWVDTRDTLHLFLQMIGKVRMKAHPKLNHWWHVTLYPDTRGLTTQRVPYAGRSFQIDFDMVEHRVDVRTNDGGHEAFSVPGKSVAHFYEALFGALRALGIDVSIVAKPYDNKSKTPFPDDDAPRAYDTEAVTGYWRALCSIASVFESYRCDYVGKQTPVQLYWHSFDLVSTRFSGKAAPLESGTQSDREAYSHEVISTGFWPGDDTFPHAAFYGYAYPEPEGLRTAPLEPSAAQWVEKGSSSLAVYTYDAMRADAAAATTPDAPLLAFLQSLYAGAAEKAGWTTDDFKHGYAR
ncbi:MAG: hypothetical protein KI785_14865 [Devosiaceae bacterium]|nr:hypothetical protein [Devosiaceae bacterium MH13]